MSKAIAIEKKSDKPDIVERIEGRKKERNYFILQALAKGYTQKQVSDILAEQNIKLSQNRISEIASENQELLDELTFKNDFAVKAGRIRIASRILQKKLSKKEESKKDILDWLEYLRREEEGSDVSGVKILLVESDIMTLKKKQEEEQEKT